MVRKVVLSKLIMIIEGQNRHHLIYFTIVLHVLIYDYALYIFLCMSKPILIFLFIKHNFKHDVHAPFKFVIF